MIFWIILILVILFLAWLLFAPLILVINTSEKKYYLELQYLLKISFIFRRAYAGIKFRVFFIPFEMDMIRQIAKSQAKEKKKKKEKKDKEKEKKPKKQLIKKKILVFVNRIFKHIRDNINTFDLKYLHLGFDTGDPFSNAMLIPALSAVNTEKIRLGVNFTGDYFLNLRVENRIYRLLFIWIKFVINLRSYFK